MGLYSSPLQEAFDSLSVDVELSRRQGWRFAAKLVRGAYMYQERERAQELGYDDPINPTYEATNRMYHRWVLLCWTGSPNKPLDLEVATTSSCASLNCW